jgi:glycosyltransferase involved in cell wall biosynthesis
MAHLAFLVTEDWFFASHFLPMLESARGAGFTVSVIAREREHREIIEAAGATFVPFEAERGTLNPFAILATLWRLHRILRAIKPDILHCIALRAIVMGGLAARLCGIRRCLYAVTGLGWLVVSPKPAARRALASLAFLVRHVLLRPDCHVLVENSDDAARLGIPAQQVTQLGGAGVSPEAFAVTPLPPCPPLKVALVSRMVWSKGVDDAVEALRLARLQGVDVRLDLYGDPDPSNPAGLDRSLLEHWSRREGVTWHGHVRDVIPVWQEHHLCLFPSRGGEGLPRTLLEAAACGRAILTTDVPGCRDFVREGIEGHILPKDDPLAISRCLIALARDPSSLDAMGWNARRRLKDGFTTAHINEIMIQLYNPMKALI